VSDSWFATFKDELTTPGRGERWPPSGRPAFEHIESWYDTRRLHSSLEYRQPGRVRNHPPPGELLRRHDSTHRPCRPNRVNPADCIREGPSAAFARRGSGELTCRLSLNGVDQAP
jgi:hypothetical protein